jgi:hypothetical protein
VQKRENKGSNLEVENKFLHSALETNAQNSMKKLKKMISQALGCMNLCL